MLLVLDTNVVLDLLLFGDPRTVTLRDALESGEARWIATPEMREELSRVLAYPNIVSRLASYGLSGPALLERFDGLARVYEPGTPCRVACRDTDDQKFIDLAVQHGATLLSKDAEVLTLRKRLAAAGVSVATALPKIGRLAPSASTA